MIQITFADPKGKPVVFEATPGKILRVSMIVKGLPCWTPLEGIHFEPSGIVKEFPDLKGKPLHIIKKEGLKRFKKHLLGMNELQIKEYLKEDLKKHGFKFLVWMKPGFRPQRK